MENTRVTSVHVKKWHFVATPEAFTCSFPFSCHLWQTLPCLSFNYICVPKQCSLVSSDIELHIIDIILYMFFVSFTQHHVYKIHPRFWLY